MRRAVIIILLVAVVALVGGTLVVRHRLADPPDVGKLEKAIDREAARFAGHDASHALVIGVLRDGASVVKGYGTTADDTNAPPDGATLFQIGSLSKLLTASTMQILADEDVLGMEATLGESIGDVVTLSARARDVTSRQLVTHTSGFPRIPERLASEATAAAGASELMLDPYAHLGPERMFAYLEEAGDMRAPGRFEYSNYGMGLLGHVMEHVTGSDYESLVTTRLLAPLGMHDTTVTLTPALRERLAQGHDANDAPAPLWTFAALGGAGAFASTADDLLTFLRAHLTDDGALARSLARTRETQTGGDTAIGWMRPAFLERLLGNRTALWHNGMVGGYASYLSVDPVNRTGVVVLSSKALDVTMLGTMLTRHARTQSWSRR